MKKIKIKSWKTTTAGLAAIVAAGGAAVAAYPDINWALTGPAIAAGVGLLLARDNDVTSEEAGAKTKK